MDISGGESKVWCCKEQYCIESWNGRSTVQGKLDIVRKEMARVNINILGISELKWTGMGKFNSDDHYIYYCQQESVERSGVALLVNKEGWEPKNWCFQIVVLGRLLKSPWECKEIKPVNPKGSQTWIFNIRTDAEAPILWPPDAKSWLIGKYADAGKDWGQEERGVTEDKMVTENHQLNGHEFEQTLGDSGG